MGAGREAESLARDFEPSAQTIRNWVKQADIDEGRRSDGLTTVEREELRELRRETRRQQEELEILGKAVTWFAARKEASADPNGTWGWIDVKAVGRRTDGPRGVGLLHDDRGRRVARRDRRAYAETHDSLAGRTA